LPLLQKASFLRRVITVGAATAEGAIDTNNISAQNFSLFKWRNQVASILTLCLEEAASRAPNVSFVHASPGVVDSNISRAPEGFEIRALLVISRVLQPFMGSNVRVPPNECGERHMYLSTSAMFAASQGKEDAAGVVVDGKQVAARGVEGQMGSGVYSVDHRGETASHKIENLLAGFKGDGTAKKVWDYVAGDFKKITGTESV
jgi:hypothetical protein